MEERDPLPPLLQVLRPGQAGQPGVSDTVDQPCRDLRPIGIVEPTI
ncbi:MAG: hypothetical protein K0S58_3179, partial [Nitrospira sp.]|nr:hypothetical protein [Nitrospira sp.]